ncbi:MAG TPA: hypothetical protein VK192_13210 [Sphingomicrobium sp.]|jgi:hypothetical protein|nr:hypothetical protein [Sphingomicrobium sp.]
MIRTDRFLARTLSAAAAVTVFAATTGVGPVAPAGAVIGRPLTPMSYAGVARRTTYRAGAYGAAAAANAAAANAAAANAAAANAAAAAAQPTVIYAPAPMTNCIKIVDSSGTTYRCP